MFLGYPVEPKVAICSKFLHFQLDFELHYNVHMHHPGSSLQAGSHATKFPEATNLLYGNRDAPSPGQK